MTKSKLLLVFATIIWIGCQPIMMKMYGIKNPDIENEKSIIRTALRYQLDTSNLVTVSSKDFLDVLNGQAIPDGAIYDRNGKFIEYKSTDSSCNAGLFNFIPALNLNEQYRQPERPSLQTELAKFRDLKGRPLQQVEQADFYLLIYWSVWTGKLNKDHVKIWENLAKRNTKCKIKVIKVNLDLQAYWDEKEREEIIQAISKKKK
jgi:hypothetical protein